MVPVTTGLIGYLGGRATSMFAVAPGIETPRRFSNAQREHLATRRTAGLFDFSFMGCVEVTGAGSCNFLQVLQTRAVDALPLGCIAYTLLLREDGSVIIDATLWHLAHDRYWLFYGRRSDFNYIAAVASNFDVALVDRSQRQAVIAVQGPASRGIIERALHFEHSLRLPYFGFEQFKFIDADCWIARIGYSGESGYELVVADAAAPALWQALLLAGAGRGLLECGFEAIDSLRIEAGHLLFTRELAGALTPAELGLTRLVDCYRPQICGAAALRMQRWRAPARRFVGLLAEHCSQSDAAVPLTIAPGHAVITSACQSPIFGRGLALGFVHACDARPGSIVKLAGGARAEIARLPFYDPARTLPRAVF